MPLLLSDPGTVAKSPPPQTQFTISVIFVVVFIVIIFSQIFTAIVRVAFHLRDSVFWLANYCRFCFDSISLGLLFFSFSYEISVCHMLDFLFLPFFRKFTQEIYTRARKTNTQNMRDDGGAAEAATATPSQLEVTPAPDKRK